MMLVFGRRSREKVLSGIFSCINSNDQTQSRTMTSQSPRIYTYKITFEEVPYYYYGVHKEKKFDEYYMGSPKTHKWCWELYTPKKQILELFEYNDEGWLEAQEIEKRLINPYYQMDKWCLNESCGGKISLEISRKNGLIHKENGTGICGIPTEKRRENSKNNILKYKKNGIGIFSFTPEQRSEHSRKIGLKSKENGTGIFSMTPEQRSEHSRKIGLKSKENGTGIFGISECERKKANEKANETNKINGTGIYSITKEERMKQIKKSIETNKINKTGIYSITKEERKEIVARTNSQKWMCLETGYITTSGPLTGYQKARGIDTSKRTRIS